MMDTVTANPSFHALEAQARLWTARQEINLVYHDPSLDQVVTIKDQETLGVFLTKFGCCYSTFPVLYIKMQHNSDETGTFDHKFTSNSCSCCGSKQQPAGQECRIDGMFKTIYCTQCGSDIYLNTLRDVAACHKMQKRFLDDAEQELTSAKQNQTSL